MAAVIPEMTPTTTEKRKYSSKDNDGGSSTLDIMGKIKARNPATLHHCNVHGLGVNKSFLGNCSCISCSMVFVAADVAMIAVAADVVIVFVAVASVVVSVVTSATAAAAAASATAAAAFAAFAAVAAVAAPAISLICC